MPKKCRPYGNQPSHRPPGDNARRCFRAAGSVWLPALVGEVAGLTVIPDRPTVSLTTRTMILGGGVVIREHNNPSVGGAAAEVRRVATYTYSARADPRAIGAQQDAIDAYIAEHKDWVTVAAYTDSGPDRPGLNGALDATRRGEFDMLIVHRLGRLSRRTANLATILIALDSATVGLVDIAESYDRANPVGWTNLPAATTPRTNEPDSRHRRTAIAERSRCRPRHLT